MEFNWDQLLDSLEGYLPHLLGGFAILVIGWLVALLLAAIVRGVLRRTPLDKKLAKMIGRETTEKEIQDLSNQIGKGVYYLVMLFVLVAFFQDIATGDRLSYKRPETDSNLSKARDHYLQAEQKAKSLAGSPDVRFIARARLDTLTVQKKDFDFSAHITPRRRYQWRPRRRRRGPLHRPPHRHRFSTPA